MCGPGIYWVEVRDALNILQGMGQPLKTKKFPAANPDLARCVLKHHLVLLTLGRWVEGVVDYFCV